MDVLVSFAIICGIAAFTALVFYVVNMFGRSLRSDREAFLPIFKAVPIKIRRVEGKEAYLINMRRFGIIPSKYFAISYKDPRGNTQINITADTLDDLSEGFYIHDVDLLDKNLETVNLMYSKRAYFKVTKVKIEEEKAKALLKSP